jgi:hypothetical protein
MTGPEHYRTAGYFGVERNLQPRNIELPTGRRCPGSLTFKGQEHETDE